MNFNSILNTKSRWLSKLLDRVEILFWGNSVKVDTSTETFYVFKPYPSSLKPSQYKDWGVLQSKVLSPYKGGTKRTFLNKDGVSIWAAPNEIKGIPETAMQQPFENGTHCVKGETQIYEQCWKNNVMTSCRSLPSSNVTSDTLKNIQISKDSAGWAIKRNIDIWLSKPITWFYVLIFVVISVFFSQLGSLSSHIIQVHSLQKEAAELEVQVGDKLAMQNEIQQQLGVIDMISKWQKQNGFLPQTLANVASVVIKYDNWEAINIEWQGKRLVLLITLRNTDISTLVSELERTNSFSDVAIRPHSLANTWTLEVAQK